MLMQRYRQSVARARGLSIVEFMVGVAVGLFVVGGATKLFVDYLGNNRRLLLETRVNQDLRAAADLVARDLRRGGYWRNATAGLSSDPASSSVLNPYRAMSLASGVLTYRYDKDGDDANANALEDMGVQRSTVGGVGVLQLRTAGSWQTITDPGVLNVAAAGLVMNESASRTVPLWDQCPCLLDLTCNSTEFAASGVYFSTRPRVTIRQYQLTLTGSAPGTNVTRSITETIRVRNDLVEGACPTP
jgi:prepilin peptidase dependent protein B